MSEPQKSQIGDGQDNYAGAAKQMANAAKQASKTAATTAATEGAKATAVTITVSGVKYNFDLLAPLEVNRDNKGGY